MNSSRGTVGDGAQHARVVQARAQAVEELLAARLRRGYGHRRPSSSRGSTRASRLPTIRAVAPQMIDVSLTS